LDALLLDLRYALRTLIRRPGATLAAGVSLALGIGASTAVFSVVNGLLIRSVPGITRPERLVEIAGYAQNDFYDLSWPMVGQLRQEHSVLEDLAAFALVPASVVTEGEPTVQGGLAVTRNYFDILGVHPILGRAFAPGEADFPAVASVALVTHHFWQRHLGAQENALGRTVRVNGTTVEIVGVLPPGFAGHHVGLLVDIFLPLGLRAPGMPSPDALAQPGSAMVESIGRLAPGVSRDAAEWALSAAGDRLHAETRPGSGARFTARVTPWGPLPQTVRGGFSAFLAVLSLLVGLALAMACVNVTTVLLARATERRRELAVRRAVGATRGRLARQLVTEAVVLFAVAGVGGTLAAAWATAALRGFSPRLPLPGRVAFNLTVDWRVLGFALVVTLAAGILFSLVPALQASGVAPGPALKGAGGGAVAGRTRFRSVLVGVQVGATALLLVAAGLFARALHRLETLDPGWSADGVTVAAFDLTLNGTDRTRGAAFYRELLDRAGIIPGVESAALAAKLPLGGRSSFGAVNAPGLEPPPGRTGHDAYLNRISPGYFRTLGIPLLRGRDVAPADVPGAPFVAVVNQTMAARLWPGRDAVGQRFQTGGGEYLREFEVIGVAADVKIGRLDETTPNFYYVAAAQWYNPEQILHVRSAPAAAASVVEGIRRMAREIDPNLPLPAPRAMSDALALFFLPQRIAALAAGALGLFALALAAVGVYGVTAFVVTRRAREIGIRLALGGTAGNILRLMTRQGGLAPLVGLAVGLGAGVVFGRFAREVVSGLEPGDPLAFGAVGVTLLMVAAVAIAIPVWRVLRADPMRALREE